MNKLFPPIQNGLLQMPKGHGKETSRKAGERPREPVAAPRHSCGWTGGPGFCRPPLCVQRVSYLPELSKRAPGTFIHCLNPTSFQEKSLQEVVFLKTIYNTCWHHFQENGLKSPGCRISSAMCFGCLITERELSLYLRNLIWGIWILFFYWANFVYLVVLMASVFTVDRIWEISFNVLLDETGSFWKSWGKTVQWLMILPRILKTHMGITNLSWWMHFNWVFPLIRPNLKSGPCYSKANCVLKCINKRTPWGRQKEEWGNCMAREIWVSSEQKRHRLSSFT